MGNAQSDEVNHSKALRRARQQKTARKGDMGSG